MPRFITHCDVMVCTHSNMITDYCDITMNALWNGISHCDVIYELLNIKLVHPEVISTQIKCVHRKIKAMEIYRNIDLYKKNKWVGDHSVETMWIVFAFKDISWVYRTKYASKNNEHDLQRWSLQTCSCFCAIIITKKAVISIINGHSNTK